MKNFFALILFPLVVLGPFFPAFPINSWILYMSSSTLIFLCGLIALQADRAFAFRYFPALLLFSLVICGLPILIKGYSPFVLELLISGVLGYLAFRYLKFTSGFLYVIYFLCVFYSCYFLFYGSLDDVFTPRGGGGVGVSRNFVQISLLHLYLVYYALCIRTRRSPSHLPFFIFPFIALASAGAGSTFVSVFLLLGFFIIRFRASIMKIGIVIGVLLLGAFLAQSQIMNTELASRFSTDSVGLNRILLIERFVDGLDSTRVLVGYDERVTFNPSLGADESNASRNLHNSYLNLYRDVGVFALPYILLVIYIAFHIIRVNAVLALLFIGSLIRALSDGYYFVWYFVDFILFYLLLLTPLGKRLLGLIPVKRRKVDWVV